jgi:hypothetical protein
MCISMCVYVIQNKMEKRMSVTNNQRGFSGFIKSRPPPQNNTQIYSNPITDTQRKVQHCKLLHVPIILYGDSRNLKALQPLRFYTYNKLQNVSVQLQQNYRNVSSVAPIYSESTSITPF